MTHIYHEVAQAEHAAYISGQDLKTIKAMAERDIIEQCGTSLGKNAEERDRNILIGLHTHRPYQVALALHRALEQQAANLKAELEIYKDARRQEEWSIRAALVDALNRRHLPTDTADQGFDQGMDEDIDQRLFDQSADDSSTYDDDYPYTEDGRITHQSAQDHYLPF